MASKCGHYCPRIMSPALHQKGANGIIAEYACVLALTEALRADGLDVVGDTEAQGVQLQAAVERVAGELTPDQVARANAQGQALAQHIYEGIVADPTRLGLGHWGSDELVNGRIVVQAVGHNTNSGNSADIVITFHPDGEVVELPISLKAYGKRPSSLGSKGSRASLSRIFLNAVKVSDAAFIDFFGEPATEFLALLADFKLAAKEFYATEAGEAFTTAYQQRKGSPTAKVNNPLRRKEVGQYFAQTRGFVSEHRFAELYVDMFNIGLATPAPNDEVHWRQYLEGQRFVLGMDNDILILNAVAHAYV